MQFVWLIHYTLNFSKQNRLDNTVRKFGVRRKKLETRDKIHEKQRVIKCSIYSPLSTFGDTNNVAGRLRDTFLCIKVSERIIFLGFRTYHKEKCERTKRQKLPKLLYLFRKLPCTWIRSYWTVILTYNNNKNEPLC